MLANYFYIYFSLVFYFNITTFTASSNISKGLAMYRGKYQYSLANLIVNCEYANNLDKAKNPQNPPISGGSVNLLLNKETPLSPLQDISDITRKISVLRNNSKITLKHIASH